MPPAEAGTVTARTRDESPDPQVALQGSQWLHEVYEQSTGHAWVLHGCESTQENWLHARPPPQAAEQSPLETPHTRPVLAAVQEHDGAIAVVTHGRR